MFIPGLLALPETNPDGDWQLPGCARTGLLSTVMTTGAVEIPACSNRRRPALPTARTPDRSPALPGFLGESAIRIPIHFWRPSGPIGSDSITPHYHQAVTCPSPADLYPTNAQRNHRDLGRNPPVGRIYTRMSYAGMRTKSPGVRATDRITKPFFDYPRETHVRTSLSPILEPSLHGAIPGFGCRCSLQFRAKRG